MIQAKSGDTVLVRYTGRFEDGEKLATPLDDSTVQFTIGKKQVIPGLEQAVLGMSPGEAKTVQISADQAYGPYQKSKVVEVNRNRFPSHLDIQVGTVLRMRKAGGEEIRRTVTTLSPAKVKLDGNHPLAGENLIFGLKLLDII